MTKKNIQQALNRWLNLGDSDTDAGGMFPHFCTGMSVFALVLAGELIAFALVLVNSSLWSFSWQRLGYVSMVVQWIVLLSALLLCQISRYLNRIPSVLAGALAYGVVLLVAFLVLATAQLILVGFIFWPGLLKSLLLTAIFSGLLLRFLYLQQQLRNQQQAELQSRIQALHARIRPHFLFNSMNAVASLIPVNPALAEQVVEDLSRLFRASLQEANLVSFEQEIDLCRRYVDIEQVRLGERLQVNWKCDASTHSVLVPSMLLQPLIENAIYHGVQRLPKGGVITVEAWLDESVLCVQITNPVPLFDDNHTDQLEDLFTQNQGNNMALSNIEYRLQAHFGSQATILRSFGQTSGVSSEDLSEMLPFHKVVISIPVGD